VVRAKILSERKLGGLIIVFSKKAIFASLSILVLVLGVLAGCSSNQPQGNGLTGAVSIDGSSTVFPVSQAIAEEFMKENPGVQVTVSESGTGGGFKKWTVGEIDIADASRPIKDEEKQTAAKKNIQPVEIPVAYDGIAIVVNKANTFAKELTVEELKKIWEPNSKVKMWSDVRPEWPKQPIKLYGPGTSSGTFEYFTEEIVGEPKKSRTDYTASEDDNALVKGVEGDQYSLGYFGFAYYIENKDKLGLVKVDSGKGPIEPTEKTIMDGTYAPLSRPIFIYPSSEALKRPEVKAFVEYYLETAKTIVSEVGYVPLPDAEYQKSVEKLGK
jgi:phosphate transport system substrate-binding protein